MHHNSHRDWNKQDFCLRSAIHQWRSLKNQSWQLGGVGLTSGVGGNSGSAASDSLFGSLLWLLIVSLYRPFTICGEQPIGKNPLSEVTRDWLPYKYCHQLTDLTQNSTIISRGKIIIPLVKDNSNVFQPKPDSLVYAKYVFGGKFSWKESFTTSF